MKININNLNIINPLVKIKRKDGYILKLINHKNKNFNGFGEVYFSKVNFLKIRAWKFHKKMCSNLFVVKGKFLFAIQKDFNEKNFFSIIINDNNHYSLYIPPKIWFGFQGLSKNDNLLMNFSNIIHNEKESKTTSLNTFKFDWKKK